MVAKSKVKNSDRQIIEFPKELVSSTLELQKDVYYAALGMQKAAYEFGKDKYSELSERAKSEVEDYIGRGEELEDLFVEKFDEFKESENLVAKGVVNAEEQLKKVEDQLKKISDSFAEVADKVKDKLNIESKPAKKTTRKPATKKRASTKAKAKKAPAKAKTVKKAA